MSDLLARVERAAIAKRRSDERFRAALLAAVDASASYAELARVLGVSRQAVRQMLMRR